MLGRPLNELPLVLTVDETAELLGLHRDSVAALIDEGALQEVRFGSLKRRQVTRASVISIAGADLVVELAEEVQR